LFLVVKLIVIGYAYAVWRTHGGGSFLDAWNRWDAPHYLAIARDGYRAQPLFLVFFPAYPLLIRAFLWTGLPPVAVALLISHVASVGAAYALYRLTAHDYGKAVAFRAVWYLSVFPTAYFLCAGYTESLFLFAAIACLYAARCGRWKIAGMWGCLATATRLVGVAVIPALILEAVQQVKEGQGKVRLLPVVVALGLAALGFISYLWINQMVIGSAFGFLTPMRDHWYKAFRWPWIGVYGSIREISRYVTDPECWFVWVGVALIPWIVIRLRFAASAFYLVSFLIFTSSSFWMSMPRYTLGQFPLFMLLARWGHRRWLDRGFAAISIWWLGTHLSRFIQGQWAF